MWETNEAASFRLEPDGFVLAQTLEYVVMPNDLMGFVEGRSSWARTGISVHLAAPKIDPGFEGTITLEMTNHGQVAVVHETQGDGQKKRRAPPSEFWSISSGSDKVETPRLPLLGRGVLRFISR